MKFDLGDREACCTQLLVLIALLCAGSILFVSSHLSVWSKPQCHRSWSLLDAYPAGARTWNDHTQKIFRCTWPAKWGASEAVVLAIVTVPPESEVYICDAQGKNAPRITPTTLPTASIQPPFMDALRLGPFFVRSQRQHSRGTPSQLNAVRRYWLRNRTCDATSSSALEWVQEEEWLPVACPWKKTRLSRDSKHKVLPLEQLIRMTTQVVSTRAMRNGIPIDARDVHSRNAATPIVVTLSGITIDVREVHPSKVLQPIVVMLSGTTIDLRDEHLQKA